MKQEPPRKRAARGANELADASAKIAAIAADGQPITTARAVVLRQHATRILSIAARVAGLADRVADLEEVA